MFKKKVKYAFYTLGHPSDGFYEIRHRGRGSVGLSILFVFLFAVCFSANRQYAGFVVNNVNPMEINSLAEICAAFLLFFLFPFWLVLSHQEVMYERRHRLPFLPRYP